MNKLALLLLLFIPLVMFAQTGKIVGTVTDARTGEPLIGANVIIEGTLMGTATDFDGNILILNVGPGTYNLRATYVGYQDVIMENIKVSVSLTTEINFEMTEEALQTDAIVVVAERPMINKNVTNSNTIVTAADIEKLPLRTVNSIISQQAGVVNQQGNLYVRGSRLDAVAFYLDGVLVNDALFGGATTSAINNAVEEIQIQAGGYAAEFGAANGGIINTYTKVGGENYHINVELITDNFADVGQKYLGGYSYGQSEYAFTVGGPIVPSYNNLRFFVAANNVFERSPQRFYIGIDEKGVYDPTLAASGLADTFDVYYPEGYRVNDHQNTYNVQGNVTWDLNPITFRFNGSYRFSEGRNGVGIANYNRRDRAGANEGETITAALKLTHVLSGRSFYDVSVTYFDDFFIPDMDPIFKHNITAYGDSIQNSAVGTLLNGDSDLPTDYSAYGQNIERRVRAWDQYEKRSQSSWGINANFLYQLGKHNELKIGGNYKTYEIRRYVLPSPVDIAQLARSIGDGDQDQIYSRLDNYGYDIYGNSVESGFNGPRNPIFAGFYIQDKLEFADLIINAGLRYDYFDTDSEEFIDPTNIQFDENDDIDPEGLKKVDPFSQWSPRLGFSFPVTEKTVFHAQYGLFYQQSRLRDVYKGYNVAADDIKGGFAIGSPVGWGLKPERTTQYEIGFRQQLGNSFAFDITMFYKDIKDQIQQRSIAADPEANHLQYYAWVNGDFETVKGFELKLDLRRVARVAGSIDYTFSDAMGTGSNPSSSFRSIWQSPTAEPFFPQQIAPTSFNQTHRGSFILDYRFAPGDGGFLQRSGLNMLFQFTSGFNYTRWDGYGNARTPQESLNFSTTPWTYRLDLRLDKSFMIGPVDLNAYLWITNVLNTQNIVQVFNTSGDAYDDGWLASETGRTRTDGYARYGEDKGALHEKLYRTMTYDATYFDPPRQIRLGLRIDY
jgi:outer membrane receptor protein involved in Fe transport